MDENPVPTDESIVKLKIGNCLTILADYVKDGVAFDCIATDPPYELALYDIDWDNTGVTFSPELWKLFWQVLKPGAFVAAFSHPRLYHRMAVRAEDAGFILYPFLIWNYGNTGIPQPQNVSTLFDRENVKDRKIIGHQRRSGYAAGLVKHGVQNYTSMSVPIYEKYVSEEAQDWKGYYYGLKTFKPCYEPILLAQKPVTRKRMVDNIREFGTGPLYMGTEQWPTPELHYAKAKRSEHQTDHPTVKPIGLMEKLCRIICPMHSGRRILDPFAGTGTTAIAALRLGLSCDIIEMEPALEDVILGRLDREGLGFRVHRETPVHPDTSSSPDPSPLLAS